MSPNIARSMLCTAMVAFAASGCGLYECVTESRSATYSGQLGQSVAPPMVGERDDGRVFLSLNEWRGGIEQQSVIASVNIVGFVPEVSEVHVHAGSPANPGKILWSSHTGLVIRDSVWNNFNELFGGPASWSEFWDSLNAGRAFIEVHSASGASASGGLRQEQIDGFSKSCT